MGHLDTLGVPFLRYLRNASLASLRTGFLSCHDCRCRAFENRKDTVVDLFAITYICTNLVLDLEILVRQVHLKSSSIDFPITLPRNRRLCSMAVRRCVERAMVHRTCSSHQALSPCLGARGGSPWPKSPFEPRDR